MEKGVDLFYVRPSSLHGTFFAPPSKSQTLRAILFGALGRGVSTIFGPLSSPDTEKMIAAVQALGAKVHRVADRIEITGTDGAVHLQGRAIDAGNSGIVLRFCSAVAALASRPIQITGECRSFRPMGDLTSGLEQLGVQASEGFVCGPLTSGRAFIDGSDSQPVSALLIAAAFAPGPIEIFVRHPGERPWVDMTLHWLERLGVPYQRKGYEWYRLEGRGRYQGFEYTVPGDFSSAAFPIAAALATDSDLIVASLDFRDPQGDKELIPILQRMGAKIELHPGAVHVKGGSRLCGIDIDVNAFIDAISILSVIACFAEGETRLFNGAVARRKECDRIHCTVTELQKMGADAVERDDGIVIRGSSLHGASVATHNDHRLALSLTVAGLGAVGMTTVGPCACMAKTYPTFLKDIQKAGADIVNGSAIILCGLPASGKTTVGEALARKLDCPFIDTDRCIERAYGKGVSCREIFIREGEAFFRECERQIIEGSANKNGYILSLGGGALVDEEMERLVRSLGIVVYLDVPVHEAVKKVVQQGLPPYAKDERELEEVFWKRLPAYERTAHRKVEVANLAVQDIVDEVLWQVIPLEKSSP